MFAMGEQKAVLQPTEMTDGTQGFLAEDQDRPGVVGYGATEDEALDSLDRARAAYDRHAGRDGGDSSIGGAGEISVHYWQTEGANVDSDAVTI
jgi:predicted RNase H-like HicB family nuclease